MTVTLPEDVLTRLQAVDLDLGRAIVSVVERGKTGPVPTFQPAEVATHSNTAVIVVAPVKALRRLRGVHLVPIGSGRALISLAHPQSIAQLEVDIRDVTDRGAVTGLELSTLAAVADILRRARETPGVRLEERSIIVLEASRRAKLASNGRRSILT